MKHRDRKLFLQKLYINAGRTVMNKLFNVSTAYINYNKISDIYKIISLSTVENSIYFNDCYGAFFHTLCCELSKQIYSEDIIYYIMSPYYNDYIICQMLIPDKQSFFSNEYFAAICKVNKLYTIKSVEKHNLYIDFADELFRKSEKIQQENI